jgi:amino acid adenylation domain-containing protein
MKINPEHLETLSSDEKRALLAKLLKKKGTTSKSYYPLSYNQRAIWFLHQLAPDSPAYNIAFAARIRSEVDISVLKRAFQKLIDRHTILRTNYSIQSGEPMQQVWEYQELSFEQTDASTWSEAILNERVVKAYKHPFNLEQGPILRVNLFTKSNTDHILLLTVHHIASDGWSIWVLLDELRKLYATERNNTVISLPPQNQQYTDYVDWQVKMLAGSEGEQLRNYWQQQLAGNWPIVDLPIDQPRQPVQTFRGASCAFSLSKELTQQLKLLTRVEGTTLYTTLLAAFQVLLYRYTGQEDIFVGSPMFSRNRAEFAGTVGCFMNLVILRANLSGEPTFRTFLGQVRHTVLDALKHQDYPFHLIAEQLWANRDSSRTTAYQVEFIFQKPQRSDDLTTLLTSEGTESSRINFGGLELEHFPLVQQEGQVDLTLEMIEVGGSLLGYLKYNTDLLNAETVARIRDHFQVLLESIVANPDQSISTLPILTKAERRQLLLTWNNLPAEITDRQPGAQGCIHHLFEAQVERMPDQVAVIFENEQITYQELNRRANQLAHYLRRLGLGPDMLVGICMERSIEMIVALWGVLKAGGAYVPLDPHYPQERLRFMLADTAAPILLTRKDLVSVLPSNEDAKIVCLDTDWNMIAQESDQNPENNVTAENLVYVIYTSGSTGRAKGVMIQHKSLVNLTEVTGAEYGIGPKDRVLQFASFSWDTSTEEIYPALTRGATLVLRSPAMTDSAAAFWQKCREWNLTLLDLPTAYWHELVAELEQTGVNAALPASLRVVIIGGERAIPERVKRWYHLVNQPIRLFNTYGLSETTAVTTMVDLSTQKQAASLWREVPIGRPLQNVEIYVLDRNMQPVPVGVPGELHIGGIGLTRGYLNQPELTTQRFIPNPFKSDDEFRMMNDESDPSYSSFLYKSGDLVRYLPDGNLEYVGRIDHQVKIRGFRIELGEIEAALNRHPLVQEAVVVVYEQEPGHKRLVAYLVAAKEAAFSIEEIRSFLKQGLPDYMIPAAFMVIEALPLTPNGKLDRRALPVPDQSRPELGSLFVAPRNQVEVQLAEIWGQLLGLEKVGIYDNFFGLGGDSILAIQIITRANQAGLRLTVGQIFQHQTIAGLAAVAETGQAQAEPEPPLELISLADRQRFFEQNPLIKPEAVEDLYELSPMQAGMLFESLYTPENGLYVIQLGLTLQGRLDIPLFERAWQEVVNRHLILRTAFYWEGLEKYLQAVHQKVTIRLDQHDWSHLPSTEQTDQLQAFLETDRMRTFDLAQPPLLRLTLIRLAPDAYHFILTYHHLVLDGWSTSLIFKDFVTFYTALSQGKTAHLEDNIPYRNYIAWLQRQGLAQAETHWRETLKNFTAPTPLGVDRTPAGLPETKQDYAEQEIHLSSETTLALQTLARQHQLTLNTLLQGSWAILLSRYSGEEDLVFGTVVSGRPTELAGSETMIGLFINTLPSRIQATPEAGLLPWFKKLQETQLAARQYEYSPLVQVQNWSEVPRGQPLFESIVVFENYPINVGSATFEELQVKRLFRVNERVNYPLSLWAQMAAGPETALSLRLMYNQARFDAETINRMLGHLQTLLENIISTTPDTSISSLPLLTAAERHQLLADWNQTSLDYPRDQSVHHLFAAQVAQTPDAPAVVFEDKLLTYQELDRRSNQVARHLQSLGVGPETLVGICVERSVEMVVGLLGILKAGGAYIPLDPAFPKERLIMMLADSQAPLLLTQRNLVNEFTAEVAGQVVCLDSDWKQIAQHSAEPLANPPQPEHLAYVIYTSGSTGKPKGVQIPHRAVVNFLTSMRQEPGLKARDVMLSVTTLSFDIAVLEIFLTLTTGARLVLVSREVASDGLQLMAELDQSKATVMQATPSTWRMLIDAGWAGDSQLKILCGGEALSRELANQLLNRCGSLWNMYGPTETAIWSTLHQVQKGEEVLPIGRPIANTQLYILDAHLQPVPVGVAGELYIGGDGLARGYLNRPELTAEKFIANPFKSHDEPDSSFITHHSSLIYRTGDLTRYLPDGNVEYLGRADFQVKVRGYRIELGEIEAMLRQHEVVSEAVVIVREDTPGDKRLVAYLTLKPEQTFSAQELRSYLRTKLPEYMIPAAFVSLVAFPLTPNGKINRRALPAPIQTQETSVHYVAPRTPLEELLAGIWASVLNVDQVGVHDNFFELGGHSLLATQIVSQIRQVIQADLPLRRLFEAPTVASMTEAIELTRRQGQAVQISPLVPTAHTGDPPLSFSQERIWFLNQFAPDTSAYNLVNALKIIGVLDKTALERSFNETIKRHDALRTSFVIRDGQPFQIIAPQLSFTLPVIDLRRLPVEAREAEAQQLLLHEAHKPFDLSQPPLLRILLLQLGEEEYILFTNIHHLVSDGWSLGVLGREFIALYQAFTKGEASPLPDLPIQYADFTYWQRQQAEQGVFQHQLAYWKERLAGELPVLELPTDRPRGATATFAGKKQTFTLPAPLSASLKTLSRQEKSTLFMTLLAGFQILLHRYSQQDDIIVGSAIANRNRLELQDLIGVFINLVALRTDLSGNPTFRELLRQVRELALEAYDHQDVPFDMVVRSLQLKRNLSHMPVFQIMFIFQENPLPGLKLAEFTSTQLELEDSSTLGFDLILQMWEAEQELSGILEYRTDLFDETTIARMLEQFQRLLAGIVANPEQQISKLSLLSETERHQLLMTWNWRPLEYAGLITEGLCIHQLFEAQVERSPDALAVLFENEQFSYGELNQRANQLAYYLRRLGVTPEVRIGLCMERSVEMIVALLGILKAGGAYVPLDPAYPSERLAYILQDAQTPLLLTQSRLANKLPGSGAKLICLDMDWPIIAQEPTENPMFDIRADHLAYIIYTSGSTGKPKGVMIEHRALVNYIQTASAEFALQPEDRILQFASINFDTSAEEIYPCLSRGATLVLRTDEMLGSIPLFLQKCQEWQLSVLDLPTAYWHELTVNLAKETLLLPDGVRLVIIGGEKALPERLKTWQRWVGNQVRLVNTYGPTEATIVSTMCDLTNLVVADNPSVELPIGRPIYNTQVYVLDQHLQPVPVGVPGELYIGGAGLARGYLNQPELTAEKFIANPFKPNNESRITNDEADSTHSSFITHHSSFLYKSGDLVRYLPDGNLEYVGRADHQVKIRGYRIELGEIETVLNQHPAVQEALVIVHEVEAGYKRLAAYLVPVEGQEPSGQDLRGFLKQNLPDYMIPSVFILLETLPLTPNGKLDRKALLALDQAKPEVEASFVAPRTPTEETLANLWTELLGVERVGIYDNFFELGGHSLLAIRLISHVRQEFEVELPLRSIFEAATIADLAVTITQLKAANVDDDELLQLLAELDELSPDEAQMMLNTNG